MGALLRSHEEGIRTWGSAWLGPREVQVCRSDGVKSGAMGLMEIQAMLSPARGRHTMDGAAYNSGQGKEMLL